MFYLLLKVAITVVLVFAVSEIAKRDTTLAGLLASLPLVSVLALSWLWVETRDAARVAGLATSVFWMVLPSLGLFLLLPAMIRKGFGFYVSMGTSILVTLALYWGMLELLKRSGSQA